MGKQRDCIDAELSAWFGQQHLFFVATAPLSADAHINVSPKGGDSLRVLGEKEVVYQDYTGSGAETIAHVRENGRIVLMFCAFDGRSRIARLHGRGTVILPGDARFEEFARLFPAHPGTRAFIRVDVERISTSCGFGVPLMDFRANRPDLEQWAVKKGPAGLDEYHATKNAQSIDGLPALR